MLERERRLHALVLGYAKLLVADIDETRMGVQPAPGMNTPRWILGHLCIAADYGAQLLGVPPGCPPEWGQAFGPGSDPGTAPAVPTRAQLLASLEAVHARLGEAAARATEPQLAAPHPFDPLKALLPTLGDFLAHLMTTHPMMHLGQLSAWRRTQGLPGVLGF